LARPFWRTAGLIKKLGHQNVHLHGPIPTRKVCVVHHDRTDGCDLQLKQNGAGAHPGKTLALILIFPPVAHMREARRSDGDWHACSLRRIAPPLNRFTVALLGCSEVAERQQAAIGTRDLEIRWWRGWDGRHNHALRWVRSGLAPASGGNLPEPLLEAQRRAHPVRRRGKSHARMT
jgi:hypothetical protein